MPSRPILGFVIDGVEPLALRCRSRMAQEPQQKQESQSSDDPFDDGSQFIMVRD